MCGNTIYMYIQTWDVCRMPYTPSVMPVCQSLVSRFSKTSTCLISYVICHQIYVKKNIFNIWLAQVRKPWGLTLPHRSFGLHNRDIHDFYACVMSDTDARHKMDFFTYRLKIMSNSRQIISIWFPFLHVWIEYHHTLLKKKCTLISSSSPGDPGSLTLIAGHVECVKN